MLELSSYLGMLLTALAAATLQPLQSEAVLVGLTLVFGSIAPQPPAWSLFETPGSITSALRWSEFGRTLQGLYRNESLRLPNL